MDGRAPTGLLPAGLEKAELIAHGGFASVYKAWQPDFHREVAVKVLAADAGDPAVRSRFEREVRAMGAVSDHPNVVPVYDAGITGERPYLVMPFLAGGSLADAGPLPADDVVRIGIAVADALDAAHAAGLLHRDVKPANILRTARGEPKLADFGVARFADATTTHGQLALTLAFAAPEVLRGESATIASDVYSLGATLHALLRGAPPFAAAEDAAPMAVALRIVEGEPPDLRAAGVPAGLAAVVERAMAKDPEDRFPTAAALSRALASSDDATTVAVAPAPVTPPTTVLERPAPPPPTAAAPPAPAPPPARPPERRSSAPWLPLLVGLAVVVAIVAVALSALGGDDDPEQDAATSSTTASTTPSDTTPETTTTTTEAPPSTTAAPAGDADGDAVAAATEYFALLDAGDIDAGWERLSPRYQDESGRDAYEGFWSTIDSVEVLSAEPGADPLTAVVELRYLRTDGSTATETNTLRFVEGEDGQLLVDGSS